MLVAGEICHGAATAEPGNVAKDQMGVAGVDVLIVEALARQGSRTPVAHQNIGAGGEFVEFGEIPVIIEVQRHRFLASTPHGCGRQLVEGMGEMGLFYQQHFSAEIRQDHGCHSAGGPPGKVQYTNAVERLGQFFLGLFSR